MGFLTDGYSWRLFQFDAQFNLYFADFIVDSKEKSLQMLGISFLIFLINIGLLTLLAAGVKPVVKNQDNCPLWLELYE